MLPHRLLLYLTQMLRENAPSVPPAISCFDISPPQSMSCNTTRSYLSHARASISDYEKTQMSCEIDPISRHLVEVFVSQASKEVIIVTITYFVVVVIFYLDIPIALQLWFAELNWCVLRRERVQRADGTTAPIWRRRWGGLQACHCHCPAMER